MDKPKKCPKCGGEMEKGAIVSSGFMINACWYKDGLPKHIDKITRIDSYRCIKCNYLENYATDSNIRGRTI